MGIDWHRMAHGLPHFCPMESPEFIHQGRAAIAVILLDLG